ncbi:MAG: hypothetical protein ACPGJS_03475 [Flammeovirgaceae bacterium]
MVIISSCVPQETDFLSPVPIAIDGSEVTYTSFVANWESALGVDAYVLEVATDANFNNKLPAFPIEVTSTFKAIEGLEDGKTYFFRVRAIFNGANTDYSNTVEVATLSYNALFPQNLRLIENGVTEFRVQWDSIIEAEGYIINLALDEAFTNPIPNYYQLDVGTDLEITFSDLLPDEAYYCKVQSYTYRTGTPEKLISGDSEILMVTTQKVPAPMVKEADPITPIRFTAHWEAVENADRYLIDVSEDETFSTFLPDYEGKAVLDTFEQLTGLDYTKDYYYRVRVRVKDKLSDYSETQAVLSSINTATCKLDKVYFNSSNPSTFTYDELDRLSAMRAVSRYNEIRNYEFIYEGADSNIREAYVSDNWGSPTDTITFFYNTDGSLDSLFIKNLTRSYNYEVKFSYDALGKLIKYESDIFVTGNPSRFFFASHDYTHDENGEIKTITGREFVLNQGSYRDINWEIRYDEKLNPFVLLPQSIASFVPFTLNHDRNTTYIPFFPTRNFSFVDFGSSTEIVAYDYNSQDMVDKQLGFFDMIYEYVGCD